MLSEMDVTGQAFEDMQEQNMRLLQQLREKDDANFKLMSEVGSNVINTISFQVFSFTSVVILIIVIDLILCFCSV